jgi:predicted ATPase
MWRSAAARLLAADPAAGVAARHAALVRDGVLAADAAQAAGARRLGRLEGELADHRAASAAWRAACGAHDATWRAAAPAALAEEARREAIDGGGGGGGILPEWLRLPAALGGARGAERAATSAAVAVRAQRRLLAALGPPPAPPPPPRGVFLHGPVGAGKSMLMDLFFAAADARELAPSRRRLHFNTVSIELNERLAALGRARAAARAAEAAAEPVGRAAARGGGGAALLARLVGAGALGGPPADASARASLTARRAALAHRRRDLRRRAVPAGAFEAVLGAANSNALLGAARGLLLGLPLDADGGKAAADAGAPPAARLVAARRAPLLCFDELQSVDPFTVAALKAVLAAAAAAAGTLVATGNRPPAALPRHGLHEAMHAALVGALEAGCEVVELAGAAGDYRRRAAAPAPAPAGRGAARGAYVWPLGAAADAALAAAWAALPPPGAGDAAPAELRVAFGRALRVARRRGAAAWFDFGTLCGAPLGAADYAALAAAFPVLFLSGVPALTLDSRDRARRLISLVDEYYERPGGRLVVAAAAPPDALFDPGNAAAVAAAAAQLEGLQFEGEVEGARLRRDAGAPGGAAAVAPAAAALAALGGAEERFAFARAASRLHALCEVPPPAM